MVLETITELSSIRLQLPDDLTLKENKLLVKETMKEVIDFIVLCWLRYLNYITINYHCWILLRI